MHADIVPCRVGDCCSSVSARPRRNRRHGPQNDEKLSKEWFRHQHDDVINAGQANQCLRADGKGSDPGPRTGAIRIP